MDYFLNRRTNNSTTILYHPCHFRSCLVLNFDFLQGWYNLRIKLMRRGYATITIQNSPKNRSYFSKSLCQVDHSVRLLNNFTRYSVQFFFYRCLCLRTSTEALITKLVISSRRNYLPTVTLVNQLLYGV